MRTLRRGIPSDLKPCGSVCFRLFPFTFEKKSSIFKNLTLTDFLSIGIFMCNKEHKEFKYPIKKYLCHLEILRSTYM